MEAKIIKRCSWCNPKHLMDNEGNYIPGSAEDKACPNGFKFSDGVCVKAEKKLNNEMDKG
jgi:hypothetical protein